MLSKRTKNVVAIVDDVELNVYRELNQHPDCSEDRVRELLTQAFPRVAQMHGVQESTVRDACVRSSKLSSTDAFFDLLINQLLGGNKLSRQLVATSKKNESASSIVSAL